MIIKPIERKIKGMKNGPGTLPPQSWKRYLTTYLLSLPGFPHLQVPMY